MPVTDQAFVTLATNDAYSQGALVVGKCLRRHGTSRQTVVMVTSHVSQGARAALARVFHQVKEVEVLDSSDWARLIMMGRPELGVTLTKLHCWALTEYSKCVFLDADVLVLCNVDELFDRQEFSAAPDPGWPDCFNSGVFVFRPSLQTHNQLLQWARERGSFDGGDQGLLNSFFSGWATEDISKHLPFIYNLSTSAVYTYLPAFQQYGPEAKIVHFLGAIKPWHCKYDRQKEEVYLGDGSTFHRHLYPFMKQWWAEYWQPVAPSFTQTYTWEDLEAHHQKAGSVEVTHKEDSFPHTGKASTPAAPKEMGTHRADTSPGDEGVASVWTRPQDTPPGDGGVASEWTHPQDTPPGDEGVASEWTHPQDTPPGDEGVASEWIHPQDTPLGDEGVASEWSHPQDTPPGDEGVASEWIHPQDTPPGDEGVASEWIHPQDTPPGDEGVASEWSHPQDAPPSEEDLGAGVLEGSQSEELVLNLPASVAELAAHLRPEVDDLDHKRRWEEGRADYLGKDAFDNIRKKLDTFLE